MTDYREILRLASKGLSRTSIGATLGYSRNTVAEVLQRAKSIGIEHPLPNELGNLELRDKLYPERIKERGRRMPDCEKVHKELGRRHITLTLLWDEYCAECRQNGEIPYAFTQFRYYYHRFAQTNKATMHIKHKPGEQLEVDWAGQTAELTDKENSEIYPAYVFVATLPCSGYTYVEAFLSQNQESWITAHIHAFEFYGGSPCIITSDNLKTGVEKANWYSPTINRTYHEMAEHYGCVVMPARVRKPKDKPSVESAVGGISTWVISAIRNRRFFQLSDLNEAIEEKMLVYNEKPFQKKPGSRFSAFMDDEREFLQPLPENRYELAVWKKLTPGFNYHVSIDHQYYSVPHEYIKHEMDVRVTNATVEVFYQGHRVCSHAKLYGKPGQYHTVPEHMPEKHRHYSEWNADRFISWAKSIGEHTKTVITAILTSHKIEQQSYRACIGVLKLADKYGVVRLEAACERALIYTPQPSYKNIDSILKSGSDKLSKAEPEVKPVDENHAFIRGADYYGRKK